jgi:hypothetical protein
MTKMTMMMKVMRMVNVFFKKTGWYEEINYMHNWSYKHVLY